MQRRNAASYVWARFPSPQSLCNTTSCNSYGSWCGESALVKIWVLSNLHQWEDQFDATWKVRNDKNDVDGKSELVWVRNVEKNAKEREKWEKNKKIRKREKFGFGGTWFYRNCVDGTRSYRNCVDGTRSYRNRVDGTRSYRNRVDGTRSYGNCVGGTWTTTVDCGR